jgi:cytoskeletal protein RodZ
MNIPSTGNSGNKNQKWPRLAILATATLLLSAISFIGVGAIPQPQQAFAQNVTQSISQDASQSNTATQTNTADQSQSQAATTGAASTVDQSQTATSTQSNEATQSNTLTQSASQVANVTGGS